MNRSARLCIVATFAVLLLGSSLGPARSDPDALGRAEEALASAFMVVREAEQAGANVSVVLAELDRAAGLLARAESLARLGAMADAAVAADEALVIASRVAEEAPRLRLLAVVTRTEMLRLAGLEWGVSLMMTVVLGYLAWLWFEKWYYARLFDMVAVEADRDDA